MTYVSKNKIHVHVNVILDKFVNDNVDVAVNIILHNNFSNHRKNDGPRFVKAQHNKVGLIEGKSVNGIN